MGTKELIDAIVDGDKVKVAFEKAESKDIQASFLVREEDI